MLAALTDAGLIHCLVEPHGGYVLYRGERPSAGTSVERVQALAAPAEAARHGPFVYLLVQQTPNQPAWQLAPGQPVDWLAATIVDPATGEPALLAFSSLVRAVAFMQSAVRVSFLININKIGKFPAAAAGGWAHPTLTDPDFAAVRAWRLGPRLAVDRHQAVTGDE